MAFGLQWSDLRNRLIVMTKRLFWQITEGAVNFLRDSCSNAPGALEKFSNYAVALLRGCWRKFTGWLCQPLKVRVMVSFGIKCVLFVGLW